MARRSLLVGGVADKLGKSADDDEDDAAAVGAGGDEFHGLAGAAAPLAPPRLSGIIGVNLADAGRGDATGLTGADNWAEAAWRGAERLASIDTKAAGGAESVTLGTGVDQATGAKDAGGADWLDLD